MLEDRLMREAADIWIIAHNNTIPISVALRAIADRLSSSLSAVGADSGALPVPASPPGPGREVQLQESNS